MPRTNFERFIRDQLSGNVLYQLTSPSGETRYLTPDEFCDTSTREIAEGHLKVITVAPQRGASA